jgi:hypothetical protein
VEERGASKPRCWVGELGLLMVKCRLPLRAASWRPSRHVVVCEGDVEMFLAACQAARRIFGSFSRPPSIESICDAHTVDTDTTITLTRIRNHQLHVLSDTF